MARAKRTKPQKAPAAEKKPKQRKKIGFWIAAAVLCVLIMLTDLILRQQSASDWYVRYTVPSLSSWVGGLFSMIPVPVSEIVLAAAAVFIVLTVLFLISLIFLYKRAGYRKFVWGCVKTVTIFALLVGFYEVRYQTAMMHSTPVSEPQLHDFDELTAMWNYTVKQLNTLCAEAERDANHHLVRRSDAEIQAAIDTARQKLHAEYPNFAAKPPLPKTSLFSAVVTNFNTNAYYIEPWHETVFTIRTQNRNTYPSIYAHEYSHTCGFYREDEANYFGLMLCLASDDVNIQYAGWLQFMPMLWDEVEKEFFAGEPVNEDAPDYIAYYESLEPYDDYLLMICDRANNYKLYHEDRGEEVPPDDRREEPTLPDAAAAVINKQAEKHYDNLREQLGAHYYDGVVQLVLDRFADQL